MEQELLTDRGGEGCLETLSHLFVDCPRLSVLVELLRRWFRGLGKGFIFG